MVAGEVKRSEMMQDLFGDNSEEEEEEEEIDSEHESNPQPHYPSVTFSPSLSNSSLGFRSFPDDRFVFSNCLGMFG